MIYFERLVNAIIHANSPRELLTLIVLYTILFTWIFFFIINPIIFNFFIIPQIEKDTGKKLNYYFEFYNMFLFSKYYYRQVDISQFIVKQWLASKHPIWINMDKINPKYALKKINYNGKAASKFKIFISFFSVINMYLSGIAMVIFFILYTYK